MRVAALKCAQQGKPRSEIIMFFGISLKTLSNWIRMEREDIALSPNVRGSYHNSDTLRNELLRVVSDNPDATLEEFSQKVPLHPSTIHYHLKKLAITRKETYLICREK